MGRLVTVLGAVYAVVALLLAVVAGFMSGTLLALPFALIPRGRRERYTVQATRLFGWLCVRVILLARPQVRGLEHVPRERGALIVCNHRSWLDPLLIATYLKANGLSKREILYLPVIGFYGWLAGVVFVDRSSLTARKRARDEMRAMLTAGNRMFVFPEGTRSRTGELGDKVHLGLIEDCHRSGVAVLPCAVAGTERTLPVGAIVAFPLQRVRLTVGELVEPSGYDDPKTFASACWQRVVALAEAS